jgi:hypothetical protein
MKRNGKLEHIVTGVDLNSPLPVHNFRFKQFFGETIIIKIQCKIIIEQINLLPRVKMEVIHRIVMKKYTRLIAVAMFSSKMNKQCLHEAIYRHF